MKRKNVANYVLMILVVAAVAGIAVANLSVARDQQPQAQSNDDKHQALVEAIRRGGIREATKIKKDYVGVYDPHLDWGLFNIEKLTKNSEAVIVGVPAKNRCKLSTDGQIITTDYDVFVQEVLKGNIQQGSTIKVSLPGGKVKFEDGTTAEIETPNFMKMVNGRTYALYLNESRSENGIYELTAGPQGLLELPTDGTRMKSHARPTDPIAEETKDKDTKEFLKEARKQAQNWPLPSKCCN